MWPAGPSRTMPTRFTVAVTATDRVTALAYPAAIDPSLAATLVLAHGAGAGQTHPFMVHFAEGLAARGLDVVTFDFVYTEQGRRAPDRGPKLEACYRGVVDAVRERGDQEQPLLIGGKSMGGRIASQIAAAPEPEATDAEDAADVAGVVALGYPLHPPGRPEKMRDAHLPRVPVPMLVVQGSRDSFGSEDELRPVLGRMPAPELYVVEDGDHSLNIRRKSAPPQEEIYAGVMDKIVQWARSAVRSQL